jgi:hypothetical protein
MKNIESKTWLFLLFTLFSVIACFIITTNIAQTVLIKFGHYFSFWQTAFFMVLVRCLFGLENHNKDDSKEANNLLIKITAKAWVSVIIAIVCYYIVF